MSTIQINRHENELLKEYGEGSIDEIINQLIDDVEDMMPVMAISPKTTVRVSKSTMDRLKAYALTDGESYRNIIARMLVLSKTINNEEK